MEIEAGMKFRGNVNGAEVLILKADAQAVTYRSVQHGTVFTIGRNAFERCDVSLVEGGDEQ